MAGETVLHEGRVLSLWRRHSLHTHIAILFLALKVGNLVNYGSAPGYRLEARFDNIGGLKARAPVICPRCVFP